MKRGPAALAAGVVAADASDAVADRLPTEVNRIGHKFQPSFGGANWREPEGWSCIPL